MAVAVAPVPAQAAGKIPAQAKVCPQAQAPLLSLVLTVALSLLWELLRTPDSLYAIGPVR